MNFCLVLKILYFLSKGSLNIPEYRCLLIGRVQYLYTIEHAVENMAYHRFQLISDTLISGTGILKGPKEGFLDH